MVAERIPHTPIVSRLDRYEFNLWAELNTLPMQSNMPRIIQIAQELRAIRSLRDAKAKGKAS
jgi:hypothetical protein